MSGLLGGLLGAPPHGGGGILGLDSSSATQQAMWSRERELQLQATQRAPCPPPIGIDLSEARDKSVVFRIDETAGCDMNMVINPSSKCVWHQTSLTDTPWQAFCRELRQEMDEWLKLDMN